MILPLSAGGSWPGDGIAYRSRPPSNLRRWAMMFINKPRNRILLCIVIVLFATMSTTGWPLPGLSGTPLTMVRGGKDNCRGDILFRANGKSVCATQPGTRVLADTDFSTGVETDILSGLLNSTRWGGPGSQRQPRSGDTSKSRHENPLVVTLGTQANWLTYVTAEFSYLFGLMQRLYGWHGLGLPIQSWEGLMSDLRRVLDGELPDILIFIEEYPGLAALGPKPASLSCYTQIWMFSDDLHAYTEQQHHDKAVAYSMADVSVHTYAHLFPLLFPEFKTSTKPVYSSPHAALPMFQMPFNPTPWPRVLLSGSVGAPYPGRVWVKARIEAGDTRFVQLEHPGYMRVYNQHQDFGVGVSYAQILNSMIAAVSSSTVWGYTVAKMMEIPATGALLLANDDVAEALADLGFQPFYNYIAFNNQTLDSIVDWVLDDKNRAEVDSIRRNGQALVWGRHLISHRAATLDVLAHTSVASRHTSC